MTVRPAENGSVRLPWQLAWAIGGLLFLAGMSWTRQEITAAENKARIEMLQQQVLELSANQTKGNVRMDGLEKQVGELRTEIAGRKTR